MATVNCRNIYKLFVDIIYATISRLSFNSSGFLVGVGIYLEFLNVPLQRLRGPMWTKTIAMLYVTFLAEAPDTSRITFLIIELRAICMWSALIFFKKHYWIVNYWVKWRRSYIFWSSGDIHMYVNMY